MAIAASNVATASRSSASAPRRPRRLRLRPGRDARDEDRAADDVEPLAFAEHVLGPAQADAAGRRSSGPGRPPRACRRSSRRAIRRSSSAQPRIVWSSGWSSKRASTVGIAPTKTSPVEPSTLIQSPSSKVRPLSDAAGALRAVVDDQLGAAGDARLADLAGDDRGVRRGAAAGGQDALGHGHPVEVVGRGLDPDEDDLLAAADPLDRDVGVEHGLADRGAGRRVQALCDPLRALTGAGIELGAQELVDLGRSRSGRPPPPW